MKQVVQDFRSGQVAITDVPPPALRPEGLLVQTAASLISIGTERMVADFARKSIVGKARSRPDLVRQVADKARREGLITTARAVLNRLDSPMAPGYSATGIVRAVGASVEGFKVGDRVACGGGGFASHAELLYVPRTLVVHLPSDVSFESGAFVTLGAIALQGIRLADVQLGDSVAVIGLGLLGQLACQMLTATGARVFGVDIDAGRANLARQLGCDNAVVRASAEAEALCFSQGRGFDAVLITADTASNDPVEMAGAISRDKGRVVAVGAVGLSIPRKVYYEKELGLVVSRSYGPGRYDVEYEGKGRDYPYSYVRWTEGRNMEAFVRLLSTGQVNVAPLITHRFPIEHAADAYQMITADRSEPYLGVVLTYHTEREPERVVELPIPARRRAGTGVESPVGIGLLGAGNFVQATLLPAMRGLKGIDLVSIASASGVSARHLGQKYGFRRAVSSEDEMLADPSVDCLIIATRHHLHVAQTVKALEAGKHAFVEKPLALNESGLREVVASYREAMRRQDGQAPVLMVGFNRRYAPLVVRLKEFLNDVREPLMVHYRINAGYIPANHWTQDLEQGGGRIVGEVCHFVDLIQYLVGSLPRCAFASALPDGGKYHSDNVSVTIEFDNGAVGSILYSAAGDKSYGKERLEVFGGGKIAVLDDFRELEMISGGRRRSHRMRLEVDKGHRGEVEAFVRAIRDGGDNPIPLPEMIAATLTTFRVIQSLAERQALAIDLADIEADKEA